MGRRLLIAVAVCVAVGAVAAGRGRARAEQGPITPQVRAAGLRFAAGVAPADRGWITAAVKQARPEAAQLIDDVDGLVTVQTFSDRDVHYVGVARGDSAGRYSVAFNLAYLDADRRQDRDVTVVHELGHIVDFVLVPDALRDRLAAGVPHTGACLTAETGDCTAPAERFADTFAKWALRGAVSTVGAGYGVATPASLEDWGAPLAALAVDVQVGGGPGSST